MSSLLLPGSWVRAASVMWSPSPFSLNTNFSSSIVRGSGHPIYALQIAWLPLCVRFSSAPPPLVHAAVVLKPLILLTFHHALRNRKYRLLFSSKRRDRPGPKGS